MLPRLFATPSIRRNGIKATWKLMRESRCSKCLMSRSLSSPFFARWHEIAWGSTIIVHLIHRKQCWLLIFDRYAWFNANSNFCFMNCQHTACKSIHSLPINSVHQLYWVVIIHNNYINTWKVLTAASLGSSVSWFPMTCNGRDSGCHGVSSYCWNIMKLIWYAVFQYIPIISFYRDMKHEN